MISTSREQRNIVKRSVTLGGQRGAREIKDDSVITETIVRRLLNPGVQIDPVVKRGIFIIHPNVPYFQNVSMKIKC